MKRIIRIGQFEKLALYFPFYLGIQKGFFASYGLDDIELVTTSNDAETYNKLLNHDIDLGLSDPIFAASEQSEKEGDIIGVLVSGVPLIAVSLTDLQINDFVDFSKYKIGTFKRLNTVNTLAKYFLGEEIKIEEYEIDLLIEALKESKIDIALILPEQSVGHDFVKVFDFKNSFKKFLFSGFTVASFSNQKELTSVFKLGITKCLNYLHQNKEESFKVFCDEFPNLNKEVFEYYMGVWPKSSELKQDDWIKSFSVWSKIYPEMFKQKNPAFLLPKKEDKILATILSRKFSRDFPNKIENILVSIKKSLATGEKMHFVSFWGGSEKIAVNQDDLDQIKRIEDLRSELQNSGVPTEYIFILANRHAITNGYDSKVVNTYLLEVKQELDKRDFKTVWLSDLWESWGITSDTIKLIAKDLLLSEEELLQSKKMMTQAQKHYQGEDSFEGLKVYITMRQMEAPYLSKEFANSILVSYTDRSAIPFLPDMPILFLFTLGKEIGEPSWFIT